MKKESELEQIHEKTLYLLEHVGVDFEHSELIDEFKRQGIKTSGNRVFFDRITVEKAVGTLLPSFTLKTPFEELKIGEGGQALSTASGPRKILREGKLYDPTIEDYLMARKLDATSKIINLSSSPLMNVGGLPKGRAEVIKGAYALKYSKHPVIMSCFRKKEAEETITLARDFYDTDEGYYTIGVGNVISPLRYGKDDVEAILTYVRKGQPVVIACCSIPGMTSPITIGGTIVQNNAEVLAGIIMTQIVKPGAPVVYGNATFVSNMRKAVPVSWGPEVGVFIKYAKAMADYYGLPYRAGGSLSAAKDLDFQNGAETAMSLMATMECRTDFVFHALGEMDGLNIFSFEKYVLDEEVLEAMESVKNRDFFSSLSIESIEETGPGGNYLVEEETVELYKEEIHFPNVYNIDSYTDWENEGRPSVIEKAKKVVEQRVAAYELPEYTKKQQEVLKKALEGCPEV